MRDLSKTDSEIQGDVLRELAWDTRIAPAEIGVAVQDGIVTLTGTVHSWAKKVASEEAAHRVGGVLDVANDIAVRPAGDAVLTDAEIAAAVRHALEWDVFVPDRKIHSTVTGGVVTLRGCVENLAQREDAERAVRNLAGVGIVFNEITVASDQLGPDELHHAIEDALSRHAERDARRVHIDIEGSRVTLHGCVHSWREREAIVGAVTGTRGVEKVIDRLKIA